MKMNDKRKEGKSCGDDGSSERELGDLSGPFH